MQPVQNIIQLRQLLQEQFPHLRSLPGPSSLQTQPCYPTGLPQIDNLLHGGLPKGEIIELASTQAGSGNGLIIQCLLRQAYDMRQWIALIDGQDCFDPSSLDQAVLSRLLWVRCGDADQALKAGDLLLRDGNLPLVLMDLQINPAAQLRRIPTSTWYRFQRIIEANETTLLVFTPRALVSKAHVRLSLQSSFAIESLSQSAEMLLPQIKIKLTRRRSTSSGQSGEQEGTAEVG